MAKSSTTTAIAHTTDADYQAWGGELSGMFDAMVGFPKSGDTGQVTDWATETIPAANTTKYEIRYLNDSLHATKPVYVKIEYGTGTAGRVALWITVSSSTNGAGTMTGTIYYSRAQINNNTAPSAGTYFTGVAYQPGFIFCIWKRGHNPSGTLSPTFGVYRTVDSTGAITTGGVATITTLTAGGIPYRYTYIGSSIGPHVGYALWPGGNGEPSLVGGAPQVLRHYMMTPEIQVVPWLLSYKDSEIGDLSEFSFTPVGVTPRTYIAFGGTHGPTNAGLAEVSSMATLRLAVQWEA